jgi:hypothetical protein
MYPDLEREMPHIIVPVKRSGAVAGLSSHF